MLKTAYHLVIYKHPTHQSLANEGIIKLIYVKEFYAIFVYDTLVLLLIPCNKLFL